MKIKTPDDDKFNERFLPIEKPDTSRAVPRNNHHLVWYLKFRTNISLNDAWDPQGFRHHYPDANKQTDK